MARLVPTFVALAITALGPNYPAGAQDVDAGKTEYQSFCATCHGVDGKGAGPISPLLKVAPPDLTVLAKKNDGVFPFSSVYKVIDGRQAIVAHGSRDMPIWGNRYTLGQIGESIRGPSLIPKCSYEFASWLSLIT
jgi:mono/diheme cytochrome c family protein